METYDSQAIEQKWQQVWADAKAFEVPNPGPDELENRAGKSYVLEMLPYPSGSLHIGHLLVYTIGDVATHFRRRNGMRVLHPQGFDSFGLPAENAAIAEGGHPREITERNIENIRRSMRRIGWTIDWTRVLSTHDVGFYRWTQWLFLKFFERDLAYRKGAPVKWCPNDQTVIANEQVLDGRCERCGAEVEARMMEQWFFRTTAYADALLDDLDTVELAGADQGPAAELDRALRGRRGALPDRGARARTCRSSRPGPTRSSARRSRPRSRARVGRAHRRFGSRGDSHVREPRRREEDRGACGRPREDRRRHRPARREPGQR